jgi:hypothetical protein
MLVSQQGTQAGKGDKMCEYNKDCDNKAWGIVFGDIEICEECHGN